MYVPFSLHAVKVLVCFFFLCVCNYSQILVHQLKIGSVLIDQPSKDLLVQYSDPDSDSFIGP